MLGYVFPCITNSSLISIGKLCDDGCIAVFDWKNLKVYKNNELVVEGLQNFKDGLWDVKIPQKQNKTNMIIRKDKTKMELAEYLYQYALRLSLVTF